MAAPAKDNPSLHWSSGPKRDKAILALITEPTIARAAEVSGVGQRTLYKWLEDTDFVAAFRKARRDNFAQAIAAVQRFAPAAVVTLAKIMGNNDAPYAARVSAASALLKFSRESIELDELAIRLEALEQSHDFGAVGGSRKPGVIDMTSATDSELAEAIVDSYTMSSVIARRSA